MEHSFDKIISIDNLLAVWQKFLRGKRNKKDVMIFQSRLADNLISLRNDLAEKNYRHGPYTAFNIADPKPRRIHKACVRDRIVHHLIYNALYNIFDRRFIHDSYSCRNAKGMHRALDRFRYFAGRVSRNHTRTCYVLKCDVRKFFANIDQTVLTDILEKQISDLNLLWLIKEVLSSFWVNHLKVGLPLGNLTSQLFANVYLDELDQCIKQELRVKYYLRYADDFVILSTDKEYLESILRKINIFLEKKLKLFLHVDKVFIQTYATGVDFLGWTHFPFQRQIRTITKRRMIRRMSGWPRPETVSSYRGLLRHGDTYKIRKSLGLS